MTKTVHYLHGFLYVLLRVSFCDKTQNRRYNAILIFLFPKMRLETMVLMGMDLPLAAIRGQIAHGLDLFVHLGRLRDHSRKVLDIREVCGYQEGEIILNALFTFRETEEKNGIIRGVWEKKGNLQKTGKLKSQGISL